jgi:hypothetical protein
MRDNYAEEEFSTREERDDRWEKLMLVKPHVYKATTSREGKTVWLVRYPVLVLPSTSNTRNATWS